MKNLNRGGKTIAIQDADIQDPIKITKPRPEKLGTRAPMRNRNSRNDHYTPPRSMTPAEKEYYDKHKTLKGMYGE